MTKRKATKQRQRQKAQRSKMAKRRKRASARPARSAGCQVGGGAQDDEPALVLPDPRVMERSLAALVGSGGGGAVDAAQDLMYEAWESEDPDRRIALAREALEVSPDCADAYTLLANESTANAVEVAALLRKAVEAGERALGAEAFERLAGHFWGALETRPYMRARASLAECLCALGQHDEAIEHYFALLALNPNDNQGIRDLLLPSLLEVGRDADALALLEQYEDDGSAMWAYGWALAEFLAGGDSKRARARLSDAIEVNPHVLDYLVFDAEVPDQLPQYHGFGDRNEAILVAVHMGPAWLDNLAAAHWLTSRCEKPALVTAARARRRKRR